MNVNSLPQLLIGWNIPVSLFAILHSNDTRGHSVQGHHCNLSHWITSWTWHLFVITVQYYYVMFGLLETYSSMALKIIDLKKAYMQLIISMIVAEILKILLKCYKYYEYWRYMLPTKLPACQVFEYQYL